MRTGATTSQHNTLPVAEEQHAAADTSSFRLWERVRQAHQSAEQMVTFLFVRLTEVDGEPGTTPAPTAELLPYHEAIRQVGGEYGGIMRTPAPGTSLLLFPSAEPDDAPARPGIHAAVELRRRLEEINRERLEGQKHPFRIGIGVHTSPLALEGVAQKRRLSTLNHHIRAAEGLSALNRQAPFPAVFLSKNALQALGNTNGYTVQNLGEAFPPDQRRPFTVYALM